LNRLDTEQIETEATAAAGVSRDVARDEFAINLRVAVNSANHEAALSPAGIKIVHDDFLEGLANRLRTDRWIAEMPEIAEEAIERPLFLTGLPRSGTTYFQYLFDNDPAFRLLKTWETARPAPASLLPYNEREQRRAASERDIEKMRTAVPGFDAMHLTDVDGPDECHKFLAQSLGAIGFHNCQNMPAFCRAVLDDFDLDAVYRIHKRQLQLLQWKTEPQRWALKYPNHIIAMDNIVRIYPDAAFLITHRDPVQTLASLCKLTLAIRKGRSVHVDPKLVGRQMKEFVQIHFERMIASRRDRNMERRIIDVDYYRLAAAPDVVLAEVYVKMGIEMTPAVKQAIANWRQQNPPGKRGVHSYSLDAFGLDPEAVAEEYHAYFGTFDVPREAKALG
jgi:hypothetical protein